MARWVFQQVADGWYVLAQYNLNKNQVVASWNQYNDLINKTNDGPLVQLGYNYAIKQVLDGQNIHHATIQPEISAIDSKQIIY